MSIPEVFYTPSLERVRDGFAHSYLGDGSEADPRQVVAEQYGQFDRWIARHDAAIRATNLQSAEIARLRDAMSGAIKAEDSMTDRAFYVIVGRMVSILEKGLAEATYANEEVAS